MSAGSFSGNGFADQPSVIYGYTDDSDKMHIREISRSGHGDLGASPGDVIERDSTNSNLENRLPELPLPGQDSRQYEDCGDDIPVFACEDCGSPVYVGRTCSSPLCSRDWAAAVKSKTVRTAGKLWAMQQVLNHRHHEDIDQNHVIASMPDFLVDSDDPIDRALLVLKTLLAEHWGIENFCAVYHPYRIKQEHRKDQYEHGGESGDGDMTWKDVLNADSPKEYIYHSPHFHIFFPAKRRQFDYSVATHVQAISGWSFHRITKGGEESDSNISVSDLDDLVHQLTYCFSHAGIQQKADRHELTSRLKGEIHNLYVPDDISDRILASFCSASQRLLGVGFANLANAACSEEVSSSDVNQDSDKTGQRSIKVNEESRNHPLDDVFGDVGVSIPESNGGATSPGIDLRTADGSQGRHNRDDGTTQTTPSKSSGSSVEGSQDDCRESSSESPVVDDRTACGGDLVPMHEARSLLDDSSWCRQAEHVAGLRAAVKEWEAISRRDSLPWIDKETQLEPD